MQQYLWAVPSAGAAVQLHRHKTPAPAAAAGDCDIKAQSRASVSGRVRRRLQLSEAQAWLPAESLAARPHCHRVSSKWLWPFTCVSVARAAQGHRVFVYSEVSRGTPLWLWRYILFPLVWVRRGLGLHDRLECCVFEDMLGLLVDYRSCQMPAMSFTSCVNFISSQRALCHVQQTVLKQSSYQY